MQFPRNNGNLNNARNLRKNMTKQERHLWYDCLRYCRPRFRRQEIIGNYIADFFCYEARLVVEVDGSQHYEPEERIKDNARTAYFQSLGINVLRFQNNDVDRKFDSVCQALYLAMEQHGITLSIEEK